MKYNLTKQLKFNQKKKKKKNWKKENLRNKLLQLAETILQNIAKKKNEKWKIKKKKG